MTTCEILLNFVVSCCIFFYTLFFYKNGIFSFQDEYS